MKSGETGRKCQTRNTSYLSDLLELRSKEEGSFNEFRNAFSKLGLSPEMNRLDVLDKVNLEIVPILHDLERKIKSWRKEQFGTLIDNSAISVFSLGAAALAAPVSGGIAGLISILAGGHFSKAMVPAIRKLFQEPPEARASQMYFAWRAQRIVGK